MALAAPRSNEAQETEVSAVQAAHQKVQAYIQKLSDNLEPTRRNNVQRQEINGLLHHPFFKNPTSYTNLEDYLKSASKAALDKSCTQEIKMQGEVVTLESFFTEFGDLNKDTSGAGSLLKFLQSLKDYEQRVAISTLFTKAHSMGIDTGIRGNKGAVIELLDIATRQVAAGKTAEEAIQLVLDSKKKPGEKICDFLNKEIGESNPSVDSYETKTIKEYMTETLAQINRFSGTDTINTENIWNEVQKAVPQDLKDFKAVCRLIKACLEKPAGTWTDRTKSGRRKRIMEDVPPRYNRTVLYYLKEIIEGRLSQEDLAERVLRDIKLRSINQIVKDIRGGIADAA